MKKSLRSKYLTRSSEKKVILHEILNIKIRVVCLVCHQSGCLKRLEMGYILINKIAK